MPSKPPFHKQETRFSCVPACLRMILLSLGVDMPESDLLVRCDSTILGTSALAAVDAVRVIGFGASAKHTLTPNELKNLVAGGQFPIVFVSMLPIDARDDLHALVVTGVSQHDVTVLDPLTGERTIPLPTFTAAWGMRHNLAILIER
jgi:ABC-type bacteriocin/lantibiotic exporter with double-glycine peptidase domain